MDFCFIQYYSDTFYECDNAQNITCIWDKMLEIVREFLFTIVSGARRPLSRSYAEDREYERSGDRWRTRENIKRKKAKKYELCDEWENGGGETGGKEKKFIDTKY